MKFNKIKYKVLFFLIITIGFISNSVLAQVASKQQLLFKESEELYNSNPNEALKIGLLLLESSISNSEKAKANLLIAKIYKIKGDYNNALTNLYQSSNYPNEIDAKDNVEINLAKAKILKALYVDKKSNQCLIEATNHLAEVKEKKDYNNAKADIELEQAISQYDRQNYNEALKIIQKAEVEYAAALIENNQLHKWYTITKGRIYTSLADYDKANYYFEKATDLLLKDKNKDIYAESHILNGIATISFHKKEYEKTINYLLQALEKSKPLNNIYINENIYKKLVYSYLALKDKTHYNQYNNDFLKINSEIENTEQETINTIYNLIDKENEDKYLIIKNQFYNKILLTLLFCTLILIACSILWYKLYLQKNRLKEIINYLEVTRNNFINRYTEKKEINKKIFIPQETEQSILTKLKKFENSSKFTNKDMSLAVLAGQLDTNTKYLSEIINKHYHVNFNTYVNKLRINYIVEKLKTDSNFVNYKISYLADACGFSSHSSFATIFKSITGIVPMTFIELLKEEKESEKNKDLL